MAFTSSLSLRQKLLLLVVFPLLLICLYTAIFSLERKTELDTANGIYQLAMTTELLNIVHIIQYERGIAIAAVSSNYSKESIDTWNASVEQSRRFIKDVDPLILQMTSDGARDEIIDGLHSIKSKLKKLEEFREQFSIEKLKDRTVVFAAYTDTVKRIQNEISNLLKLAPGSQVFQLADSITAISDLKENAGRERALAASILTKGQATEQEIREFYVLNTRKEVFSEKFLELSPVHYQERFLQINADADFSNVINKIISSPAGSKVEGDPDRLFKLMTVKINAFRELEKTINDELIAFANQRKVSAMQTMVLTIIIACGLILLFSFLANVATKRLVDGFLKLRSSALEFAVSGELKNVELSSNDELGDLANAFNQLINHLKHVSDAVECVSKGDFTQRVEVKSKRDRLALSLNHMIKTLQNSVSTMSAENWLKTGLSKFASDMGNEEDIDVLVHKSISFISEYIKAKVGVIYLVDDNGTSNMCGSYAFARRKENNNQFQIGESIVGQCVREKNPIVISDIPADYIQIQSGIGQLSPLNLAVYPLVYQDKVFGVIELGAFHTFSDIELNFLQEVSQVLAVSVNAALSREQLSQLVLEKQMQSEELQSQQEELEHSNSELEAQAEQLRHSQVELEEQKESLISANNELESRSTELRRRNEEVEQRSEELESARLSLEIKANELASASKYKSEFLANMSHELRTPLNSLLLLSQTLTDNDDKNLTADQIEALNVIYASGRDLLTLINDILDLSKVEAGKLSVMFESADVNEMIYSLKQQFEPLADDKGIQFIVDTSQLIAPIIYTDSLRLLQILRNLIGNAIKFTDSGRVELNVFNDNNQNILFKVKDSGIGIPKKLQKAIFEAFQQGDGSTSRKYSGTGLGLTISKELVSLIGAKISLQSVEGSGAEFTVILPVEKSEQQSKPILPRQNTIVPIHSFAGDIQSNLKPLEVKPTELESSKQIHHQKRALTDSEFHEGLHCMDDDRNALDSLRHLLLVVEDDLEFAKHIVNVAHKKRYQCVVANNGKNAIEMAKKYRPHAIVMDMILPDCHSNNVIDELRRDPLTKDIPIHLLDSLNTQDAEGNNDDTSVTHQSMSRTFELIDSKCQFDDSKVLLVIEDDLNTQVAIRQLFKSHDIDVVCVDSTLKAEEWIQSKNVATIILDLGLSKGDAKSFLQNLRGNVQTQDLPVVIYTGKDIDHEEYKALRQFTDKIVIKGNVAQERLLNEVVLFLHSMPSNKLASTKELEMDNEFPLKDIKVLLVDDDMRNTFALASLLKKNGVDVVTADNGKHALEQLSECDDIKLAIMDIMMPIMDGYETIKSIRKRKDYKSLPIIALTAKAMTEDRNKCLEVGANDYMSKPVDSKRLLSTLKMWVNAR